MAFPTGSVQVTGNIGTTASSDTYPTHLDYLGYGGLRSVTTIANRDAITTQRRVFGMVVTVTADPTPANNKSYILANTAMGGADNVLTNNSNWIDYVTGVSSFNTRTGAITLTSLDVTDALTFTPYNASNPNNYIPLTALSSTATGLTYTNTTGVFSLASGYVIPTTTEQTNWDTAYTNRITSLTTTGNSGAATLISNVLNIPTYTLAGLGGDNASNITSGTLADARLSSNVMLLNGGQTITGNNIRTGTLTIINNAVGSSNTTRFLLENQTTAPSAGNTENAPIFEFSGHVYSQLTGSVTGGVVASGSNEAKWRFRHLTVAGGLGINEIDNILLIEQKLGTGSWTERARLNRNGFSAPQTFNTLTLGSSGNNGNLQLRRSSDGGGSGQVSASSVGGVSITGQNIILGAGTGDIIAFSANPSFGMRYRTTQGLYLTVVGNAAADPASRLVVDGNVTIGENVAAPTNGLRVLGQSIFRANAFFGGTTTPTARIHIEGSTNTAGTGQLKLISSVNRQSIAENGTINNISGNLEFVDSSTVYILAKTLQGSGTLDFGSIAAGATETLTITLTGVTDGDVVSLGVPNSAKTAGLIYTAWVSATDTVSIEAYNSTGSAIDPTSATFKVAVIK